MVTTVRGTRARLVLLVALNVAPAAAAQSFATPISGIPELVPDLVPTIERTIVLPIDDMLLDPDRIPGSTTTIYHPSLGVIERPRPSISNDPAVGLLHLHDADGRALPPCTAFLVASDIVVSAAHCSDYRTGAADARDRFALNSSHAPLRVLELVVAPQRGTTAEERAGSDLLIALLVDDAPSSIRHFELANRIPSTYELTKVLGWGCTTHSSSDNALRQIGYYWGLRTAQPILCEGDSGGPVLIDGSRRVAAVASRYVCSANDRRRTACGTPRNPQRDYFATVADATNKSFMHAISELWKRRYRATKHPLHRSVVLATSTDGTCVCRVTSTSTATCDQTCLESLASPVTVRVEPTAGSASSQAATRTGTQLRWSTPVTSLRVPIRWSGSRTGVDWLFASSDGVDVTFASTPPPTSALTLGFDPTGQIYHRN